ncbi:hypothetical protein L218DRAFT_1077718 [Marasmius fiardii PR-910]|nr:hypothetical protein L218DRAFT_1077718 [Marasmius fiardii PR-910]
MALVDTSGISVEGDVANIVHGNQIINYNTRVARQKEKDRRPTLYDEFCKITSGKTSKGNDWFYVIIKAILGEAMGLLCEGYLVVFADWSFVLWDAFAPQVIIQPLY